MRIERIRYGLAVCLAAMAVAVPHLRAWAADAPASPFVFWTKGEKEGEADVTVQLLERNDIVGGVSALQVSFQLEPQGGDENLEVSFGFDGGITKNESVTVQDFVYDSQRKVLTVFMAGNATVLKGGEAKKLGTITVDSEQEVKLYTKEVQIAGDGQKKEIALGDQETKNSFIVNGGSDEPTPAPEDRPSRSSGGGGGGSRSGAGYQEPVATAAETAGTWEWTGTVWKFKLRSGAYARNTWIYVKGEWYHIDQNGDMNIGWYQGPGGVWYYLTETGAMKKGWIELNGVWYHLRDYNGKMHTGWILSGDNWFYADASGAMTTGWQLVNDKWYYLNPVKPVPVKVQNPETGQMEDSVAGQRPYGAMYANETTPDGFQVDDQGARR